MTELEQEIAHLQELRAKHRRNVRILEKRVADQGPDCPMDLLNKLEDAREQLRQVEERLEELLAQVGIEEIPTAPAESARPPRRGLPKQQLAKLLGAILILVSCIWLGYELGQRQREKKVILSGHAEIFDFNDGDTSGWKPLEWDDGWIYFEKSGNIEVMGKDFVLDSHSGPFLKYPLNLKSERRHHYTGRNAIYKPVDEKVIGILANVFYESEEEYSFEEIHAGFVVPCQIGEEKVTGSDWIQELIPNRWNTIVWSLYSPVWWDAEDKGKKWEEFKELFGGWGASMHPGLRLDHNKLDSIGVQFYVYTEDGPKEFKGTAYIDNIVLIYRHVP